MPRSDAYRAAYPDRLLERERSLLAASPHRRRTQSDTTIDPRNGVALSGGGIRSATFALGLFQALARLKLIRHVDFLSTVSGGGYFGCFLGGLFTREYVRDAADVEWLLDPERGPAPAGAPRLLTLARQNVVPWLRQNGRYLAPRGSGDALLGAAAVLRNWTAVFVMFASLVLAVMLAAQLPRVWTVDYRSSLVLQFLPQEIRWSPWIAFYTFTLGLAVSIGWSYWLTASRPRERRQQERAVWWWLAALLFVTIAGTRVEHGRMLLANVAAGCILLSLLVHPLAGIPSTLAAALAITLAPVDFPDRIRLAVALAGLAAIAAVLAWIAAAVLAAVREGVRHSPRARHTIGKAASPPTSILGALLAQLGIRRAWYTVRHWTGALRAHLGRIQHRRALGRAGVLGQDIQHLLSAALKGVLVLSAAILIWGLIDTTAQTIYYRSQGSWRELTAWIGTAAAGATALAAYARQIATLANVEAGAGRRRITVAAAVTTGAVLVTAVILISVDLLAYAIVWKFEPMTLTAPNRRLDAMLLTLIVLLVALVAVGFGRTFNFLNRSSHHPLYSARLVRAYLGASNERRWSDGVVPVITTLHGDDVWPEKYWGASTSEPSSAYAKGAPLHLVNVTINETIDGETQLQQQDRKGLGMALGPAGLSVGIRHHVALSAATRNEWPIDGIYPEGDQFRVFQYDDEQRWAFPGEPLSLGSWIGISGAAFSTGIGSRTSIPMATLAGVSNVRLGYWWDSEVKTDHRWQRTTDTFINKMFYGAAKLFPSQIYFLHELLARFPGTARPQWYLSDGGHFENMGGYELLRRRVPLAIVVDAEADPDYAFSGLANLVRKARIDFGANVEFLDDADIASQLHSSLHDVVGSLARLRPDKTTGRCARPAAVAKVKYDDDPATVTWLLYIKPTLCGREPADVVEYAERNRPFPQQTTIDQFFDEAQWESYRKLGEHIGQTVFGPIAASQKGLTADALTP